MDTIIVCTDGGARGNPGPAGIGIYVADTEGAMISEYAQAIGNATNNFAEYQAVATALTLLKKTYGKRTKEIQFVFRLDSELVQKQLSGEYQIKDAGLVPLFIEIHNLRVSAFPHVSFTHVPRAQNKDADRLVNEALDAAGA